MKAVVVFGSRSAAGQTAKAAEAFIEGMESAGASVERVFLPLFKIERCRQCDDSGWGLCIKEGRCVIEDDFGLIVSKISRADAVVFANPVYYGDLSESLRAFLDRLRRTCIKDQGKKLIRGKPAVGIAVAGGGGGGSYRCIAAMESILGECGFEIADLVPARRQNLDNKCAVLRETGKWFAGGK